MERAKGFEPSTPTLARLCSTPELRPRRNRIGRVRPARMIIGRGNFARLASRGCRAGGLPAGTPIGIVPTMPAVPLTPEQLFRRLDALDIAHQTVSHPPVFTVAEAAAARGHLPGGHCKSLFLKDKKGGFWLVIMLEERRIDLNKLAVRLAAPRFSFGAAADLGALLGVRPGSVTPFALVNDGAHRVTPVLDREMLDHDPLNYHPLANDRTTAIAPADLLRFIAACGHQPRVVDLAGLER
jgi:Ala-tRNA(Pro) deacylase